MIPVGFGLLLLQGISLGLHSLLQLAGKEDDRGAYKLMEYLAAWMFSRPDHFVNGRLPRNIYFIRHLLDISG